MLTPASVFRNYVTDGVPDSGNHQPEKAEIIQLLNMFFGVSRGGWVVARTLAELNTITPPNPTDGGVVLTGSGAGYYDRDGGAWVFGRGFPDTFARVMLSGSATAQIGSVNTGVNPSSIEVFFAQVITPNAGALTLSIDDGPARPVMNIAGNALSAGEWTGMVMFYLTDAGQYQLLIDAGASASAAESASLAGAEADRAEQAVADALAMIVPDGAVTTPKLALDAVTEEKLSPDVRRKLKGSVGLLSQSNLVPHGTFAKGWSDWSLQGNSVNAVALLSPDTDSVGVIETYFSRTRMQLSAEASARTMFIGSSRPIRVDPAQSYSLGAALTASGGPITANLQVKCYDQNLSLVGTLTVNVTAANGPSASAVTDYHRAVINPVGGAAPAWPAGTVAAIPRVGYTSTGVQSLFVWALWLIAQEDYPGNVATLSQANGGGGTHEAVSDATNLYVLNHGFNHLVKFDSDMKYVAHISIGDYPHDIVSIGGKLWVALQDDAAIKRVDKLSFAIDATYAIPGARSGFALGTDGARLFCGAGASSLGQTPTIYEVNTSTGAFTSLSTDVDGGGANLPVRFFDGSLWSVKQTPSEVKRINPSGGATLATISAAVGSIYGLGAGEGYIFANGRHGVAQIDPATNMVVKRYWYRETAIGHSNIEVHGGRAYACSSTGVMVIDIASRTAHEIVLDSGNNKWACALPGGDVVVGAYCAPWLFRLGAS